MGEGNAMHNSVMLQCTQYRNHCALVTNNKYK